MTKPKPQQPAQAPQPEINILQTKARVHAEHKAKNLFIELHELTGGDKTAMVQALATALMIIKADITALIPAPPQPAGVKVDRAAVKAKRSQKHKKKK